MATTKYSKWIPSPLDGLSLEELLDQMSEFFLQSGFSYSFHDMSNPHALDALRQAIAAPKTAAVRKKIRLTTVSGKGLRSGIDLDDSASLLELMERHK